MADDQPFMGSWFLRMDRFADVHMVAAQNKRSSCGLACIKTVIFKVNKLRPGATALTTERIIEQRYRALEGEVVHDFDTNGSEPDTMVAVLNSFGIGNWAIEWPALNDVGSQIAKYVGVDRMGLGFTGINAIRRGYPVILLCYWKGGGGHGIVVDTVTSVPFMGTYATILDPWDADIHFEEIKTGVPFTYRPKAVNGVNLWGKVKGPPAGIGTVEAIIYCQKSPGFFS